MSLYPRNTMIGIYRLDNELSNRGGMAVVYEATIVNDQRYPHRNNRKVALKIARSGQHNDEQFMNFLRREIETLQKLRHPGVVRVYPIAAFRDPRQYIGRASNLPNDPWYFAMELLPGKTLAHINVRKMSLAWRVELLYQFATVLQFMHHHEIAHRDLKPENIMFRNGNVSEKESPQPVLIDFGLALGAQVAETTQAATITHASPERVEHLWQNRNSDQNRPTTIGFNYLRADVWAFGVIAYEVLNGRYLYDYNPKNTPPSMLAEMIRRQRPNPMESDIPEPLQQLVLAMLEKDPRYRPDMGEIAQFLESDIQIIAPRI